MDTLQMIAILVVIILLLMFLYYIFNKQKTLTTGIRDAQKYHYVDPSVMNLNESGSVAEMAVSIWVYVSGWDQRSGHDRIILYMGPRNLIDYDMTTSSGLESNSKIAFGDSSKKLNFKTGDDLITGSQSDKQSSLVIWLDSIDPKLYVGLGKDSNPSFSENNGQYISVDNFPLQKWVSITVSVYQNVLDLYLNGKLVKSVLGSSDSIAMSSDEILVSLGNPFYVETIGDNEVKISNVTTGFKGYTSRLSYYNKALTPKQVYNIYKNGPGTSYLGDILGDRGVNINFMDGEEVTKTFSL